ncbi:MAG: HD domain-containing protein [Thermoguttaceae bacterium]|nr:HD domain-containing protein [Thermoguttaceae bacterium]
MSPRPHIPPKVLKIVELLEAGGATEVLIVGGFVRDALLGVESKDVDVEVYGLSYSQIRDILAPSFHVDLVGQSFGVMKVGRDVDVALPRRESKNGVGHKGFSVETNPDITPREAFGRRDFTINAIGMRRDGSLCDPFDGVGDLKRGVLRAPGPAFKDDPLRVLRGMQFAARFGFRLDAQTVRYCREVFDEFATLSPERIYDEWRKWALKGVYPELGLETLRETGWLAAFPELAALVGCAQNPKWHPEGDVWTHTKAVCREAAVAVNSCEPELSDDERTAVMFAALAHDFGKPDASFVDENGEIRSHGHAKVGAPLARTFLERMRAPLKLTQTVENLVYDHMSSSAKPTLRAVRRLAKRLEPASVRLWALLCRSDALGCDAPERYVPSAEYAFDAETEFASEPTLNLADSPLPTVDEVAQTLKNREIRFQADVWLDLADRMGVRDEGPTPLVQGRDLIPLGVKPGPAMGETLRQAFEAQLDGEFATLEAGVAWLRERGFVAPV